MKLRPTIFLSGVSSEFGSFREAVAQEILRKGCYPLNQPTFDVDYREIETILREKLSEADAVVHLVGFRFGDEPKGRPADKPRRSYTQLEFDVARELEKPVYLFLSSDTTVRDSEDELQLAHRQAIQNGNDQFHYFKDKEELCKLVAGINHVAQTDFRVDISRIDKYAPADLIGREDELALLNDAWLKVRRAETSCPHVLTFVALGGEGKTSLVAKWLADLAFQKWPGCDSAFAWSFYSQGTREQYAASSDLFFKEAITFFGNNADKEFAASAAGAYEKGQRLARIVGQRRALLILDGLEPLQYAPNSPTPGELKDGGITALLKGLAARSDGLCIVTSRYSLPNLKAFWQTTAPEIPLTRMSQAAGVHLLKTLGVKGSEIEFKTLVEDVRGHALTLNLLGTYLRDAHGGDIRRRDLIKFEEADAEQQGGHAFRVMKAYERAFEKEGDKGKHALAIVRLLGLFDRPVTVDCLNALLENPGITKLTDALIGLSDAQRNKALKRLEEARLLTVNREASGDLISVDAHPLLREYFAQQLRTQQADAWRAGHQRLYDHLCTMTEDKAEPTLEDLQPLYQAVSHGCEAGLYEEVCDKLLYVRINQRRDGYSMNKLGAFASNVGAVIGLFEEPWNFLQPSLTEERQAWLFNFTSFNLRALGRLSEALVPLRNAVELCVKLANWLDSAGNAGNLSELELVLGRVSHAIMDADRSVIYADRSGDVFQVSARRATHASALMQAGRWEEAKEYFREAEERQAKKHPRYPLLYSFRGFLYCDLLLAEAERAAWQRILGSDLEIAEGASDDVRLHFEALRAVSQRATQSLDWSTNDFKKAGLLNIAFDRLTLSRVAVYEAALSSALLLPGSPLRVSLDSLVATLYRANAQEFIVRGLVTRACLRVLTGASTGPNSAQQDLDEAWEIAERGPMRLYMADIYLSRARLFFRDKEYPWGSAEADLGAARRLIERCGYWRRKEELEDAEQVILK